MTRYLDELLQNVENRYTLAMVSARRARQITDYYNAVNRHEYTEIPGPSLDRLRDKPLSIAFDEIIEGLIEPEFPEETATTDSEGK